MSSEAVIIDPDGDILLQFLQEQPGGDASDDKQLLHHVPETGQELIVSSKVLSLASPVFKVMLNGKFREGIELAERKASSRSYTLTLLGDDTEATTILCRILHFSINDVPEKPSPKCLEKLAFLCDKYQCIGALKYCGRLWVRDWLLDYDGQDPFIDDLCRLLIFAYVIDLPHEFLDISWKLFLFHKGPFLGRDTQTVILGNHPLLRHDINQKLDAERTKCCQSFHRGVLAPLNRDWHTLTKHCYRAAKALAAYLDHLRMAQILSYDLEFTEDRFCDLIQEAHDLPFISVSQFSCTAYGCECKNESTHNLSISLRNEVTLINQRQSTFICLDCLKTDGGSNDEGRCRISHD